MYPKNKFIYFKAYVKNALSYQDSNNPLSLWKHNRSLFFLNSKSEMNFFIEWEFMLKGKYEENHLSLYSRSCEFLLPADEKTCTGQMKPLSPNFIHRFSVNILGIY